MVDVIVYDHFAVWGAYVGQLLSVPACCMITGIIPDHDELEEHVIYQPKDSPLTPNVINKWSERILLEEYGIQTKWQESITTFSQQCNLVNTTKAFHPQFSVRQPLSSFHFVGPLLYHEDRPDKHTFLERLQRAKQYVIDSAGHNGPVIFVSFGTLYVPAPKVWKIVVRTLTRMFPKNDVVVVVAMGRSADSVLSPEHRQGWPSTANYILWRSVPQLDLLPHVNAFVTHAGMNSTMEALQHGVPLVCIPFMADQPYVADRARDLGAAIVVQQEDLSVESLTTALTKVLQEPAFIEAAQRFRDVVRHEHPTVRAHRAADKIIALIDDSKPE